MTLLGELCYEKTGRVKIEKSNLYGMPILRGTVDSSGWLGERRLGKTAKALRRNRIARILVPDDFQHWDVVGHWGLRPVDITPFLRAQAAELALAALRGQGIAPHRGTVVLMGQRAERDMARAAQALCPYVRSLVICAPYGGEALGGWLRGEYGMPIQPPDRPGSVTICFDGEVFPTQGQVLKLYGERPDLAGVRICATALEGPHQENLPLLSALWACGKLGEKGLECT